MTIIDRFEGIQSTKATKAPVRVKTTANITLSGMQTIDTVVLDEDDPNLRVLVANQTDATQNGIYDAKVGLWSRAKDFDSNGDFVKGTLFYVQEGTQAGRWWVSSSDPIVLGEDDITFDTVSDSTLVIDSLTSESTTSALSAKQGKTLKTLVDGKLAAADVVADLATDDDDAPLAASQGKALKEIRFVEEKTSSYQPVLADAGKTFEMNVGTANNFTIPANATVAFEVGTTFEIVQTGGGQTTIVAAGGVTLRSAGAKTKLTQQYSGASVYKRSTNEWVLIGDITN